MNRMILTTIVLPSVLGLAQAATAVEPKPMNSSVVLFAEAKQPAGLADVALAAGKIHASVLSMSKGVATAQHAYKGDTPLDASVPRITKTVEVSLSPKELAETPALISVTLRAIVDENGIPRNISVAKSGGAAVDQKAIAAVREYRFAPALLYNQPTWSSVLVTIKIQK